MNWEKSIPICVQAFMLSVKYKINQSTVEQIRDHLRMVGLPGKPTKIRKNATTYESWDNDLLVGLLAVYENGYITNLSVLPAYRGMGIASSLLKMASKDFKSFELETNIPEFWFKRGFKVRMYK